MRKLLRHYGTLASQSRTSFGDQIIGLVVGYERLAGLATHSHRHRFSRHG